MRGNCKGFLSWVKVRGGGFFKGRQKFKGDFPLGEGYDKGNKIDRERFWNRDKQRPVYRGH
jgi:hypothetical protein